MERNELSMEVHWWGSSELNTYSCKTGSLCDSGRPSSRGQYSLHPRTHAQATMEGNWPTRGMRERQWDEPKQENRKQTGGYGRSVLTGRDTTEMAPAVVSWRLSQKNVNGQQRQHLFHTLQPDRSTWHDGAAGMLRENQVSLNIKRRTLSFLALNKLTLRIFKCRLQNAILLPECVILCASVATALSNVPLLCNTWRPLSCCHADFAETVVLPKHLGYR